MSHQNSNFEEELDTKTDKTEAQPLKNQSIKKTFNWDRMTSLLALTLSVTAILVSFAEVTTVRSHSKATVWPHLNVSDVLSEKGYEISVENKGVGPALIDDIYFSIDGQLVTSLDATILDTLGANGSPVAEDYKLNDLSNKVIASNEKMRALYVPLTDQSQKLIDRWVGKVDFELCYCSIQDDCWQTSLVSQDTRSVKNCSATSNISTLENEKLSVSSSDFDVLSGDGWTGTLRYKDYSSGESVSIPVEAVFSPVSKNTLVYRLIYPNEQNYNVNESIRISADGTRVDNKPVIAKEREANGALRITTAFRGTDNNQSAEIQIIYIINRKTFDIIQNVKSDTDTNFFERNRYSFKR